MFYCPNISISNIYVFPWFYYVQYSESYLCHKHSTNICWMKRGKVSVLKSPSATRQTHLISFYQCLSRMSWLKPGHLHRSAFWASCLYQVDILNVQCTLILIKVILSSTSKVISGFQTYCPYSHWVSVARFPLRT